MKFARVNAVSLHYRVHGDLNARPVLVFINSLGTDFRIWDDVVAGLTSHFAIVTYDKRGHGLSDVGTTPYRIEDHAADLAGLLDHLGVAKAIVCGLSVGGLIANALWVMRPDLVQALIFSNTAHRIGTVQAWNERIGLIEREGLSALLDGTMEKWFTGKFRTPENPLYAGMRTMLVRQSLAGYSATCAGIRDADYTATAPTISVPTLCIAADQDGSTPPDVVRGLADIVPGSVFETIADAGHIPCVEKPDAYSATLLGFCQKFGLI